MHVYLNGALVPAHQATISVFDRGFLLGDGVYEGMRSFRGRTHSVPYHLRRFREGLAAAGIQWDPSRLEDLTADLLAANRVEDAFIYWQVTRGVPEPGQPLRTRVPAGPMTPTVFGFASPQPAIEQFGTPPTTTAATVEDQRWLKGRLKSTSLLGNVLGAMEAAEAGAKESILVRDGLLAEGSATNVILAVAGPGGRTRLVTPSLDSVPILAGVTRTRILELDPEIEERAVSADELRRATEILVVGTTSLVTSVVLLDGRIVGDGRPGPHACRLLRLYVEMVRQEIGIEDRVAVPA